VVEITSQSKFVMAHQKRKGLTKEPLNVWLKKIMMTHKIGEYDGKSEEPIAATGCVEAT